MTGITKNNTYRTRLCSRMVFVLVLFTLQGIAQINVPGTGRTSLGSPEPNWYEYGFMNSGTFPEDEIGIDGDERIADSGTPCISADDHTIEATASLPSSGTATLYFAYKFIVIQSGTYSTNAFYVSGNYSQVELVNRISDGNIPVIRSYSSNSSCTAFQFTETLNPGTYEIRIVTTVTSGANTRSIWAMSSAAAPSNYCIPVLYMTNSDVFNIPNGGSLNLKLTSSYSANYAITLNVNPNVTVTGTNTNDSISQTFTNLTNQTQTITYTIKPTSTVGGCVGISQTITVTIPGACINGCDPIECTDCIGSFAPDIGATYVISAWVQQANSAQLMTYSEPALAVAFTGGASQGPFHASGAIIDGWQRIDTTFTVPAGATEVFVKLVNTGDNEAYFDDLRIQPLKASLKSFVYDPVSMRLMAELDENNYATFYEYDEEGALIRVKKETERGIKTIKETGNNTHKNQ